MAITKIYINDDMTALQSFLQSMAPTYFETVVFDSETNIITVKDKDNNTLFTIEKKPSGSSAGYVFTAYTSSGGSISTNYYGSGATHVSHIYYAYKATHGAIIALEQYTYGNRAGILITKNSNDKTFVAFSSSWPSSSTGYCFLSLNCICWDDVAPYSALVFSINSRNQTTVVPLISNNDTDATSYTPNAGFLYSGQYYDMGYGSIIIGETTYLTNGYWVIKDA